MCGRLSVLSAKEMHLMLESMGLSATIASNDDLRPTQPLLAITSSNEELQAQTMTWGIQPAWSKRLIINAKAETIMEKKTFSQAYKHKRCLVPCTGWYEWKDEGGSRKQKYLFTREDGQPFLMAGIWYSHSEFNQLVTLTTQPNQKCAEIHSRMPVTIEREYVDLWLQGSEDDLRPLLEPISGQECVITRCGVNDSM